MANSLSAELLAAQDNTCRWPLVEIKAGQFAADIPLEGQRLKADPLQQTNASSVMHSSGRLIAVYTQDEFDNVNFSARSVKLAYTDTNRAEYYYTDLFSAAGNGQLSDLSLMEMEDGKLMLAYVLKDRNGKYELKAAVFACDGSGLTQYAIKSGQSLPIYSPVLCRTATGQLISYIQDIPISAALSGTYTGTDDCAVQIEVAADGTQTTSQFKWKKVASDWSAAITMTGNSQSVADGINICFAANTYWQGQKLWYSATAARAAASSITLEGMPADGDTVRIGGMLYTWRSELSIPAVVDEIKIDPLGREISAENLRCAIMVDSYEGVGAGVRFSDGTSANTEVSAQRSGKLLALTALTAGSGGNNLALEVDGVKLIKTAFAGGKPSTLSELSWTPGSLLRTVTSADGISWTDDRYVEVPNMLASRKKLDTCLLRQSDGTLWLFFTYMSDGNTDNTAVYNLYYCRSANSGESWSEATALTDFTVPAEIARRPAAVQKLAGEIVVAYDAVKTSLLLDKSNPYWTDERLQGIKHLHFNPANRKLYIAYGFQHAGVKVLFGILRIDIDSWSVDRYWNGDTVPQIPLAFREGHVTEFCGAGETVICAGNGSGDYIQQIMRLDDNGNTIDVISLAGDTKYGYRQNVVNLPVGHFGTPRYDDKTKTLFFSVNDDYYWHPRINICSLELGSLRDSYEVKVLATQIPVDSGGLVEKTLAVDSENGYLIYSNGPLSSYDCSTWLFDISGVGLIKHYSYSADNMPKFPRFGGRDAVIHNNKLYMCQCQYTADYGQSAYWGIFSIDLASNAVEWHSPVSVLGGEPRDVNLNNLKVTGDLLIAGVGESASVLIFNIATGVWSLYSNTTAPGIFPLELTTGWAILDYDAETEMLLMGASDPLNWTGVIAFPLQGKVLQTQYLKLNLSGGNWLAGNPSPLVRGSKDYGAAIVVEPETTGLIAFWTRWDSSNGEQLYWDKEAGMLDLSASLVCGQAIEQTRTIDGQPGKLTFTLDKGHLYDPHNQASLISRYLRKGKKITLRWGETINDEAYWQEGFSVYVITGVKLSYKRGAYPIIAVECEDRRTLWEYLEIAASKYFSGISPGAALSELLQSHAGIAQTEIELSAMNDEAVLYYQWIDTTLKTAIEAITNRYGYYFDISLSDNMVRARRIGKDNTIDHTYDSAANIIEFTPDDSYSNLTNRVTVTGEGRTPISVEMAEESIGGESGTLGFFQHRQVHRIYYSDDRQKRAVRPRLEITQSATSIGFKMSGQMKQWISSVDTEGHWVEVTSEGPDLLPALVAALALFAFGKSQPPAVGSISEPAESKRGSWIKDAGLYTALQCLAAVGNYAFTIYGCPIGETYQTFEAHADDTELQTDLQGTVIETRIDDPLVYDVNQARQVADRELWILKAQRKRVKFSKTAHLQDDAGDTIQIPHPYTKAPLKIFVTSLVRRMVIANGNGEYSDNIEGWVL